MQAKPAQHAGRQACLLACVLRLLACYPACYQASRAARLALVICATKLLTVSSKELPMALRAQAVLKALEMLTANY